METKYKCFYKKSVKYVRAVSYDDLCEQIRVKYTNLPGFKENFIIQYNDDGEYVDADCQEDLDEASNNNINIIQERLARMTTHRIPSQRN